MLVHLQPAAIKASWHIEWTRLACLSSILCCGAGQALHSMEVAASGAGEPTAAFSYAVVAAMPHCWQQPCADQAALGQLGAAHLSRLWGCVAGQAEQQAPLAQRLDRSCLAALEQHPELLDVLLPRYRCLAAAAVQLPRAARKAGPLTHAPLCRELAGVASADQAALPGCLYALQSMLRHVPLHPELRQRQQPIEAGLALLRSVCSHVELPPAQLACFCGPCTRGGI